MKTRALLPNRPVGQLVALAQSALGMTHRRFGEALGASERTSARWARGTASVTVPQLCTLAQLVYPRNPALAASLAEAASETLESLGIVAPVALPAPQVPPHLVADVIVCAAADAIGAPPSTARAALRAAFGRARELGVSVADVEKALAARGDEGDE